MKFLWDENKNITNKEKYGVSFEQAREVFSDSFQLSVLDERFSYFEERLITVGITHEQHILVVAHLYFDEDGDEIIRIISARSATSYERRQYEYEK
ncbi:hypothetical protein EZV73_26520 [Acidaminobacter sp. JC074]|uniref:BrnT family toxin n=1 Tax=Acidaminobacter sp. JC074 TaxID=2530199 RepID=UPI001F0E0B79|nr:BrnT family toxin [Acidaminobacter sp. JC074]MCH4891161.1 hypothetical protein [Acidaminobacter sp. JC074]